MHETSLSTARKLAGKRVYPGKSSMRLECTNLNFYYPGTRKPVIDDLSFSMDGPGFNAVFGPSGSGKTSLAKCIASFENLPGNPIQTREIATILYSYNLERLPGWSTTGSHLDKITPDGKSDLKKRLCDIFGLGTLLKSRYSQLSMGQQNRINLIRYLLQDFDLLIMDESLANVDEALRQTILLAIKDFFPEKLFLYISHNLLEVAAFCDRILVFSEPSAGRGYATIRGLDVKDSKKPDRSSLDAVMLEIMNAL